MSSSCHFQSLILSSTDELSVQYQVIDEMEKCLPFFIGLLGERYGWVPEPHYLQHNSLRSEIFKKLRSFPKGLSLTHLEILYAFHWNRSDSAQTPASECCFYIRDRNVLANSTKFLDACKAEDAELKERKRKEVEMAMAQVEASQAISKSGHQIDRNLDSVTIQLVEGHELVHGAWEEQSFDKSDNSESDSLSDDAEEGLAGQPAGHIGRGTAAETDHHSDGDVKDKKNREKRKSRAVEFAIGLFPPI